MKKTSLWQRALTAMQSKRVETRQKIAAPAEVKTKGNAGFLFGNGDRMPTEEVRSSLHSLEQLVDSHRGVEPTPKRRNERAQVKLPARIAMLGEDVKQMGCEMAKLRQTHEVIFNSLGITLEQRSKLSLENGCEIIGSAIKMRADRMAIDIAAKQGCRPVPALPQLDPAGAAGDAQAAFSEAAREPDPIRRGELFAKAEKMFSQRA